MDGYYIVEVTATPYSRFGVIMNIMSKEDNSQSVTIGNMPQCTCHNFTGMSSHALGKKKEIDILQTPILCLMISMQVVTRMTGSFTL